MDWVPLRFERNHSYGELQRLLTTSFSRHEANKAFDIVEGTMRNNHLESDIQLWKSRSFDLADLSSNRAWQQDSSQHTGGGKAK